MYNVMIIGAGSIGALKENKYDSKKTRNILTHAHAVTKHRKTNLVGIVESNIEKLDKAIKKWDTSGFTSIECAKKIIPEIDIAIIATPTKIHHETIIELKKFYSPKAIILEKPVGQNYVQCSEIIKNAKEIPTIIHYNRRFDTVTQNIAKDIRNGVYGAVYNAICRYDRGLHRDGSHGIDFFNFCFGTCIDAKNINPELYITDYSEYDKTVSAALIYENCPLALMLPSDGRKYSIFDIEIYTEKAKIRFHDHGTKISINSAKKEKIFGNYMSMSDKAVTFKTNLHKSMLNLLEHAIEVAKGGINISPFSNALNVQMIINKIISN